MPRTFLFKSEHNMDLGEHGPVKQGHAISIRDSVVFMADVFLELYLHYRPGSPR